MSKHDKCLRVETVQDILQQWQTGRLDEHDVYELAEKMWDSSEWPNYPEQDARSISIEVLAQLSVLYYQLVTKEDIPAMLEFLRVSPGEEVKGWARWRAYWSQVDFAARKEALKGNPYYVTDGGPECADH